MTLARALRAPAAAVGGSGLVPDALLAGVGGAASRGFLLVLSVLVSRSVGEPRLFGAFSSVLLAVQLVATFAGLGLAQTAAQAVAAAADDPRRQDRTVRTTLVLVLAAAALGAIVLLGALPTRALAGVIASPAGDLAAATALLLAAQLLVGGLEGVLRGLRLFRVLCVGSCAASAAALVLAVPLVDALGVAGGLLAAAAFLALEAILFFRPLAARLRGPLLPLREGARLVGVVAMPTFVNGFAWNVAMLLPPLLLAREQGGLEQVALWNAAGQIRALVSFVPVVIANAALPRLAAAFAARDVWRAEVRASIGLATCAALLGFVPVALAARPLLAVYGAAYAEHAALLVLVASFVLLQVLGTSLFVVLLAAGRAWHTALVNAAWSAAVLALASGPLAGRGAYGLAGLYLWSYVPVLAVLAALAARTLQRVRKRTPETAAPRGARAYAHVYSGRSKGWPWHPRA